MLLSSLLLRLRSGDLDCGDVQGGRCSTPLVLRQPSTGLPGPSLKHDDRMVALAHIYGKRDADGGFLLRIRKVSMNNGFTEHFIMSAWYSYSPDSVSISFGHAIPKHFISCSP